MRADLPGVSLSGVDVQVEDGKLCLRGERRMDASIDRDAYLRVERPYGRFAVQVTLPDSVDRHRIKATHRDGVLEIVLPKRTESQRSRVPIGG